MSGPRASIRASRIFWRRLTVAGSLLLLVILLTSLASVSRLRLTWTSRGWYPSDPLRRGEISPFAYFHGADPNVGRGFHFLTSDDWGVDGYWVMIQSTQRGVSIGVNVGQ